MDHQEVEVKVMGMGAEEFLTRCKDLGYHAFRGGSYYIRDEYWIWKHVGTACPNIRLRVMECIEDSMDVEVDLTIKGENTGEGVLNREETILDVAHGNVQTARKFLERLGYRQQDVIKKTRRTWTGIATKEGLEMVHDCYIVFDKLESGNKWMEFEFVGLDAEDFLNGFLEDFGLKWDKRMSTKTTREIAATR
jgi:adenylate cyclase class IV